MCDMVSCNPEVLLSQGTAAEATAQQLVKSVAQNTLSLSNNSLFQWLTQLAQSTHVSYSSKE